MAWFSEAHCHRETMVILSGAKDLHIGPEHVQILRSRSG
jgi:hypothetical protein